MSTQIAQEEATLDAARLSLIKAKESHAAAATEVLENANEYFDDSFEDVKTSGREAQMPMSKKWYEIFERASRIPKDEKYETCQGERMQYKKIVQKNLELLRSLAIDEDFVSAGSKSGIQIETALDRDVKGAKLYRAKVTLPVTPRNLLLTQIRAPVIGKTDDSLIYMREHYNFVGGKTSLIHTVRKISNSGSVYLREFFDLANWVEEEDGSIFYSSQSVKVLPQKVPRAVQGENIIYGMVMKPTKTTVGGGLLSTGTEVDGTELTFISQFQLGGWLPTLVANMAVPGALASQIRAAEAAAKEVEENGESERLIHKFIERELEPLAELTEE